MSEIRAGVVLKSRFIIPGEVFSNYINYMDKEEKVRNNNLYKFSLYNDYMGNPEKTTGLFCAKKDNLSLEEKKNFKYIFSEAEKNKSVMWQHVISFDNRWLALQGIMEPETGKVNENKLREVTRVAMNKLQKIEELENAIWTASIHYNTDNIHIHIAMVEPLSMRGKVDGIVKGKLKQSTLDKTKTSIINRLMEQQLENTLINDIIRKNILEDKKKNIFIKDNEFVKLFKEVHSQLPQDHRLWNYGCVKIKHLIPKIDRMSEIYLNKYHKEDMQKLNELLIVQNEKYNMAYGTKTESQYINNKKKDLYYRLGNVILKQIKEFDKQEKVRIYKNAEKSRIKITKKDMNLYKGEQLKYKESQYALKATIELTKAFMKDEYEKFRNQIDFVQMQHEQEIKRIEEEREK